MILDNDKPINRPRIEFDTIPVSAKLGSAKGYSIRVCSECVKSDKSVFEEAVKASSLNINAKTLAYLFDTVLSTTIEKTAQDGVPRRIGHLLKVIPVLRGTVKKANSAFDPETCTCYIDVKPLKEAKCKVDTSNFRFINRSAKTKTKSQARP